MQRFNRAALGLKVHHAPHAAQKVQGLIDIGYHQQVAVPLLDHPPNRGRVTRAFLLAASLRRCLTENVASRQKRHFHRTPTHTR